MTPEILPGVYRIEGDYVGEYGYLSSYLLTSEDECLIIDSGTAGSPAQRILKTIQRLGFNTSRDVTGILCTHAHPDHVGGIKLLKKRTGAPVIIHEDEVSLLRDPSFFVKSRLKTTLSDRIAMKFEKGPLRINYKGQEPDRTLQNNDFIHIGNTKLRTICTAGHSRGHCAFYDSERKILFCGDEVSNFPNNPRKFYVDLSGSLISKRSALDTMKKLDIDYLLPAHDVPHLFEDASMEIEETLRGVIAFQECVLEHVCVRGNADIDQLVFDITQTNSIPYPTEMKPLLPTTIFVALRSLQKAGLVFEHEGVWSAQHC